MRLGTSLKLGRRRNGTELTPGAAGTPNTGIRTGPLGRRTRLKVGVAGNGVDPTTAGGANGGTLACGGRRAGGRGIAGLAGNGVDPRPRLNTGTRDGGRAGGGGLGMTGVGGNGVEPRPRPNTGTPGGGRAGAGGLGMTGVGGNGVDPGTAGTPVTGSRDGARRGAGGREMNGWAGNGVAPTRGVVGVTGFNLASRSIMIFRCRSMRILAIGTSGTARPFPATMNAAAWRRTTGRRTAIGWRRRCRPGAWTTTATPWTTLRRGTR